MAVKSIIFSEKSNVYQNTIPEKYIFTYDNNVQNIQNELLNLITNYEELDSVLSEAQNFAYRYHTWDSRAGEVINNLNQIL